MNTKKQTEIIVPSHKHTDSVTQFSNLLKISMKSASQEIKQWKYDLKMQRTGVRGFIQRNVQKIFLGGFGFFITTMLLVFLLRLTVWPNIPQTLVLWIYCIGASLTMLAVVLNVIDQFLELSYSPMPYWEAVYKNLMKHCVDCGISPGKPLSDAYHATYYWARSRRKPVVAMCAIVPAWLGTYDLLFGNNEAHRNLLEKLFDIPKDIQPGVFIISSIVIGVIYLLFISSRTAWLGHLALFFDKDVKAK